MFKKKAKHSPCYYCGLKHKNVEAQGVWHCPNPLCTGPGNAWYRSTLSSYVNHGDHHTVDHKEWIKKGMAKAMITRDKAIIAAAEKSKGELYERYSVSSMA